MLSVFGKLSLFAIYKAWIMLLFHGDTSFNVCFIVDYHFSGGMSFSMEIGIFYHPRTCWPSCLLSCSSPAIT